MTEEKTRRWGENVIIADFAGRRRRKQAEQGLRSEDNTRENPKLGGRPKGGKVGTPGANGPVNKVSAKAGRPRDDAAASGEVR